MFFIRILGGYKKSICNINLAKKDEKVGRQLGGIKLLDTPKITKTTESLILARCPCFSSWIRTL